MCFLSTGLHRAQVAALRALVGDQALRARQPHGQKAWSGLQCKERRAQNSPPPPRNSQASLKCLLKTLLKQGLRVNLEGWDGEEDGREVQKGGAICIPMGDSC